MKRIEFSKPVVVDEGVAFRVRLTEGCKRFSKVVVATKARLGVGEDAQGLALLAAFVQASSVIFAEAVQLVKTEDMTPLYL